jgi:sulfonate transport system permease protein
MAKRFDRTSIFFVTLGFLFLWELAYLLRVTDPQRFPHPFSAFLLLGDSGFFHKFLRMIRLMIFCTISGGLVGIGLGFLILHSSWLTQAVLRFLRIGLWFPVLVIFAIPRASLFLTIAAAMLCSCYHFLTARSFLGLRGMETLTHVGRETLLQVLFVSLLAQIWFQQWNWLEFASLVQPRTGFYVLAILLLLLIFINWIFRSNFELTAQRHETIITKELTSTNWRSFSGVVLLTTIGFFIWQTLAEQSLHFLSTSPMHVIEAAAYLFRTGEIWNDIRVSLLEVIGGLAVGGLMALITFGVLSFIAPIRGLLSYVLPLTYISMLVLWLLMSITWPVYGMGMITRIEYKMTGVGFLSFFPFVHGLWGLRKHPLFPRIMLAIDEALPIAFVTMMFGELWASTVGLGFMMTVASATHQTDKALVGFMLVVILLVSFSMTLRSIAKRLYVPEPTAEAVPVQAS